MSIGTIRNLGNSGGGTKVLSLYENGVWKVPYDNTGYIPRGGGFATDGGLTLGATQMSVGNVSSAHSRCIITSMPIDLTPYKYLCIKYDGSSTLSIDVTNVKQNAYICVGRYSLSSRYYTIASASSQKNLFLDYALGGTRTEIEYHTSTLTIQEIYLVK